MEYFKKCQRIAKEYKEERENLIGTIPLGEEVENDTQVKELDFHYKQFISIAFDEEYKKLNEDNIFFEFCKFSTYRENYDKRLKEFKEVFPDAYEIDFIKKEMRDLATPTFLKIPPQWEITPTLQSKIDYSDQRKKDFLIEKAKELNYDIKVSFNEEDCFEYYKFNKSLFGINPKIAKKIKWEGKQTELIELTKALIENGTLKGKQKDIIEQMTSFFDIEINNPNKLITDLSKRNNGSETLFLDKLKATLFNYIQTKNNR